MKQLGQNRLLTIDQRIVLEELRGVVRVQSYNHAMDIANPLSQADVALSYIARHRFVHEHLKGDMNPLTQQRIEWFIERFGEPEKDDEWYFLRSYGLIGLTPSWLRFHDALNDIYVDAWVRMSASSLLCIADEFVPFNEKCADYCDFLTVQVLAIQRGDKPHDEYFPAWRRMTSEQRQAERAQELQPAPPHPAALPATDDERPF